MKPDIKELQICTGIPHTHWDSNMLWGLELHLCSKKHYERRKKFQILRKSGKTNLFMVQSWSLTCVNSSLTSGTLKELS